MRKTGKYETKPTPAPAKSKAEKMKKRSLVQSYVISLLSLVMCGVLLVGTTVAWFTSEVDSSSNEMYVGILDVDLAFAAVADGEVNDIYTPITADTSTNKTPALFGDAIKWEPGHTQIRKLQLTENGDLAFGYKLGIQCDYTKTTSVDTTLQPDKLEAMGKTIAGAIQVWNYSGNDAENDEIPADFLELATNGDWTKVGTLADVIDSKLPVFEGQMDKNTVTASKAAEAYHLIALHMDESFTDASVMGAQLNEISVKLVATQLPSEADAFGSDYDKVVVANSEADLLAAIEDGANGIILGDNIELEAALLIPDEAKVTLDLNGKTLTSAADQTICVNGGNLTIEGDGKIENTKDGAIAIYVQDAKLTVNGGEIISDGDGIYEIGGGEVIINDGSITANGLALGVSVSATVNGGSLKGGISAYAFDDSTLTVTGGNFDGAFSSNNNTTVSGGTFTDEYVKNSLADGYEAVANGNGTWTVQPAATP